MFSSGGVGASIINNARATGDLVEVLTAADLPAAAVGVRTLEAGKVYSFLASVDLGTDVLSGSNATLVGLDKAVTKLETTSASPLLTATGSLSVFGIHLKNDSGKCIDYTGGTSSFCNLDHFIIENGAADTFVGVSSGAFVVRNGRWGIGVGGLIASGSWVGFVWRGVGFFGTTGTTETFFTVSAGTTLQIFDLSGLQLVTNNAGQTALSIDSGITPTDEGLIHGCFFTGPGTYVDAAGVTLETPGWWFTNNPGLESSAAVGAFGFSGNTGATTITNGTSWHSIVTTPGWTLDTLSERFDEPSDGQIRYTGKDLRRFVITAGMTVESASGTNKVANLRARKYEDATTTTTTIAEGDILIRASGQPQFRSQYFLVELAQNDYVFFEIGSDDGTNMTVVDASVLSAEVS